MSFGLQKSTIDIASPPHQATLAIIIARKSPNFQAGRPTWTVFGSLGPDSFPARSCSSTSYAKTYNTFV